MQKSELYKAEQIIEPYCIGVICSVKTDNKLNFTPVTDWFTFGDGQPFLAFALDNRTYGGYCVIKNRKFTFSVPDVTLAERVRFWGHNSGAGTDKQKKEWTELEEVGSGLFVPLKSCVAFCCKYKQFIPFDNYRLFVCEISEIYINDKLKPLYSYDNRTLLGGAERPKSLKTDLLVKKRT